MNCLKSCGLFEVRESKNGKVTKQTAIHNRVAGDSITSIRTKRFIKTFYFGIFGEFQLVVDKSTGCFNAGNV
jgi:hypothetical protein